MESSDTAGNNKVKYENLAVEQQKESSTDEKLKNIYSSDSDYSDFDKEYTCDTCKKSFSGLKPLRQHQKSGKHIKAVNREKFRKEIDEHLKKLEDDSDDESSGFGYKPYTECKVCLKEFSGIDPYRLHLKSKAHKKKKFAQKILSEIGQDELLDEEKLKKLFRQRNSSAPNENVLESTESDSDNSTASENSDVFECKECEKVFSGVEPYYIHMTSKLHKKKLKQKILVTELTAESTSAEGDETIKSIRLSDGVLICKICHVSFSGPESVLAHLKSRGHKEKLEFRKWKKEQKLQNEQEIKTHTGCKFEAVDKELYYGEKEGSKDSKISEGSFKEKKGSKDSEVSAEKRDVSGSKPLKEIPTTSQQVEAAMKKPEEHEIENTLLAYKSYKNYKKIIRNLESEEQEM